MSAGNGWLIRASGSPTELPSVVESLGGGDYLSATVDGRSLCLRSPAIDRIESQADAEWAAYEFVRLFSAALHFRSVSIPLEFQSIEAQNGALVVSQDSTQLRRRCSELSVAKVMNAAEHRRHVRSALLSYVDGGAEGLFKAYEAITYELLDAGLLNYAGGIGTREWLIQQGWVTEPEEARFLDTVLHYGRQNSAPSFTPASPIEAQRLVGKLLTKWIEHISPE